MKNLSSMFCVHAARSYAYGGHEAGSVAFVSNGFSNNGVMGYVAPMQGDNVFDFMGISVSAFGEATVQRPPFIGRGNGGSGMVILEPLMPMIERDQLWYAAYINEAVRWRFSFGRMVTVDRLQRLELPDIQAAAIPEIESLIPKMRLEDGAKNEPQGLKFQAIPLTSLFTLKSGDFHKAENLPEGTVPLVSCGAGDNGVMRFCDVPKRYIYEDALTVAYNGSWPLLTKYHPYPFAAKDDVAVLIPKQPLAVATLLFIQMMLTRETWRYSYGRKCFHAKLSRMAVLLPTLGGEVDEEAIAQVLSNTHYWQFIEAKLGINTGG